MAEPLFVGINRLSLQPGDMLVMTVPDRVSDTALDGCIARLEALLPDGVHAIVRREENSITILRAGQPVAPDVDAPTVVEMPAR